MSYFLLLALRRMAYQVNLLFNGTENNDRIMGSANNDTIVGLGGNDVLMGGSGHDSIYGGSGQDELYGGDGNDRLQGGLGDDYLDGGNGNDILDGEAGNDTASYAMAQGGVLVNLNIGWSQYTYSGGFDTLINVENLVGSNFNDILVGNAFSNVINAGLGNDVLYGGAGDDTLLGGLGNDGIVAGAGNDIVDGGAGLDWALYNGRQADYKFVKNADGSITVTDLRTSSPDGIDIVTNIETFVFADKATSAGSLPFDIAKNQAPSGADNTLSINEDTILSFKVSDFGFSDSNNNNFSAVKIASLPAGSAGVLTLNNVAVTVGQLISVSDLVNLKFTPVANVNGNNLASFNFQVQDDGGTANGGENLDPSANTITINVAPINDPTIANADNFTVQEDSSSNVLNVLANDLDVDGDSFSISGFTDPSFGSLVLEGSIFKYTPNANYSGNDSFSYFMSDGNGGTTEAVVNLTIAPAQDAPQASDDSFSFQEDSAANLINVLGNDSDADNDALSISDFENPSHGQLVLDGSNFLYTPDANYHGDDSFSYTISDGNGNTSTATVNLTITPVNDDPLAADDNYTFQEDSASNLINVLGNDSDADNDALSISDFENPSHGQLVFNGSNFLYTPDADYHGDDSFSYTISDGNGGTSTATVNLTITPKEDAPVAADDSFSFQEDSAANLINVLSNDSDADNDALSISDFENPSHGQLVQDGSNFLYTPDADYHGDDSFSYTISDGNGNTSTAVVNLTITPVEDAPVAADDNYTFQEDSAANLINVLGNDSDADNDALSISDFENPSHGQLVQDGSNFLYTPDADYHGDDSFSYTISDGNGNTSTATVNLTVSPVNDDPLAEDDSGFIFQEDSSNNIISVLGNDSDIDNDALSISDYSEPSHGQLVLDGSNFLYTPDADYQGDDSFTYTISDGQGGSSTATVNLTVAPVNNAPIAGDDSGFVFQEDSSDNVISVLDNDSDADNDALSISDFENPSHGQLVLDGSNFLYTPDADYYGDDSFSYTISDGNGGSSTATVNLTVAPVNDAPQAADDALDALINTQAVYQLDELLNNDSDVDNDLSQLSISSVNSIDGGTVELVDGTIVFTPDPDFIGEAHFSYIISDGTDLSNEAQVTINVSGNTANPVIGTDQNDVLFTTEGDDYIDGLEGNDTVSYDLVNGPVNIDLTNLDPQNTISAGMDQLSSIENIIGSQYNDILFGDGNNNVIEGGWGDDYLDGGAGIDTATYVFAGFGVAVDLSAGTATGGHDNDTLVNFENIFGSDFNDILIGDFFSNTIEGSFGDDLIDGGDASDTVSYASANDVVNVDLSLGQASGAQGNDSLFNIENIIGSNYNDTLIGDDNNNTIEGGLGNDSLDAGLGDGDVLSYENATGSVTVDMSTGQSSGAAGNDSFSNFEFLIGSAFDDNLTGDNNSNIINGRDGNDTIHGLAGSDTINAGQGDDTVFGDSGADTISGGAGNDSIDGGQGADDISGEDGNDTIIGGLGNDTLRGNQGNDSITGGVGNDLINGGANFDKAIYAGDIANFSFTQQLDGSITVTDLVGLEGQDTVINVEQFVFNGVAVSVDDLPFGGGEAPSGTDITIDVAENGSYAFSAADFGYSDPNGDAFTAVRIDTLPLSGSLTFNGDAVINDQEIAVEDLGNLVFTPDPLDPGGNFSFSVKDSDGNYSVSPNSVSMNVTPANSSPEPMDDYAQTNEDASVVLDLLSNDFDPEGDAIHMDSIVGTTIESDAFHSIIAVDNGEVYWNYADDSLTFTPSTDFNGQTTFNYTISDGQASAYAGLVTIDVAAVNDAPQTADKTLNMFEGGSLTFNTGNFSFSDAEGNNPLGIQITALPGAGSLQLSTVDVTEGQFIDWADIPNLVFTPWDADGTGLPYDAFSFKVQDDGGIDNGGEDLSQEHVININITAINDAPSGESNTLTLNEDVAHAFQAADFGFSDPQDVGLPNNFKAVQITSLPTAGSLTYQGNAVVLNQFIPIANIASLLFVSALNANADGGLYDAFNFKVQDDGGAFLGGADLSGEYTMSINMNAVNDAPSGIDKVIPTVQNGFLENQVYTFSQADFGFTDTEGDSLSAIKISTLASAGTLQLNGSNLSQGAIVAVGDIGNLTFVPGLNESGNNYASFTFQVIDDGGTANGGVDMDASPNTISFNVTNYIHASQGNDFLFSTTANDYIDGLSGTDSLAYGDATSGVTVDLSNNSTAQNTGGAGFDTIINIENLYGSNYADNLTGDAANNLISGGLGHDVLNGGAGLQDTVDYSYMNILSFGVIANLTAGTSQSFDNMDNDTLSNFENINGSLYNDELTGNAAANILYGSRGNDTMTGGAGNDTFLYKAGDFDNFSHDTITDFSLSGDILDLQAVLSTYLPNYNASTVFSDGYLAFVFDGTNTHINVDDDGSAGVLLPLERIVLNNVQLTQSNTQNYIVPVVLDLNHDATYDFVSLNDSKASFDVNHVAYNVAWVGSEDGVLVYDAFNNDFQDGIYSHSQFAFAQYLEGAQTDLEGLKAFDSNHDGILSSEDAQFHDFAVWQDLNEDGASSANELLSLAQLDIQSLSLSSDKQFSEQGDALIFGEAKVTHNDGSVSSLADAAFRSEQDVDAMIAKAEAATAPDNAAPEDQAHEMAPAPLAQPDAAVQVSGEGPAPVVATDHVGMGAEAGEQMDNLLVPYDPHHMVA